MFSCYTPFFVCKHAKCMSCELLVQWGLLIKFDHCLWKGERYQQEWGSFWMMNHRISRLDACGVLYMCYTTINGSPMLRRWSILANTKPDPTTNVTISLLLLYLQFQFLMKMINTNDFVHGVLTMTGEWSPDTSVHERLLREKESPHRVRSLVIATLIYGACSLSSWFQVLSVWVIRLVKGLLVVRDDLWERAWRQ